MASPTLDRGRLPILSAVTALAPAAAILIALAVGPELSRLSHRVSPGVELLLVAGPLAVAAALILLRDSATFGDLSAIEYVGTLFVLLGTVTVTFNGIRIGPGTLSDVMMAMALVFLAVPILNKDEFWRSVPPALLGCVFVFLAAAVLATFTATTSPTDLLQVSKAHDVTTTQGNLAVDADFAVALLIVPVILGATANSPARLRLIADLWIVSAAANGYISVLELLGFTNVEEVLTNSKAWIDRFNGLTSQPVHLGVSCAVALPVAVLLGCTAKTWRRRLLYLVVLAGIAIGIMLSGSRGALVAAVAGLAIAVALELRVWTWLLTYLAAASPRCSRL